MKTWYTKELSQIAKISVRTLHYYDKIGLLKPSLRQSNNYRLYSEADLLRLQQIIALKFLGFELSQIKALLDDSCDLTAWFSQQRQCLKAKAMALLEAEALLGQLAKEQRLDQSISWKQVVRFIEVYQMIQALEQSWVKTVLSEKELKTYAGLHQHVKEQFSLSELKQFETMWGELWKDVENNLNQSPDSSLGKNIAGKVLEVLIQLYGKQHLDLHVKILKGHQNAVYGPKEAIPAKVKDCLAWISKAIDAYGRDQ